MAFLLRPGTTGLRHQPKTATTTDLHLLNIITVNMEVHRSHSRVDIRTARGKHRRMLMGMQVMGTGMVAMLMGLFKIVDTEVTMATTDEGPILFTAIVELRVLASRKIISRKRESIRARYLYSVYYCQRNYGSKAMLNCKTLL